MQANILIKGENKIYKAKANLENKTILGELVFNTSMTGYEEILTDPSYKGQIVVMTYPIIGNYGVSDEFMESNKIQASAFIVKDDIENSPELNEKLKKEGIICLSCIDTRMLAKKIRTKGAINCLITTDEISKEHFDMLENYVFPNDTIKQVSNSEVIKIQGNLDKKIAVVDFGIKRSITDELRKTGYSIDIYPYNVKSDVILNGNYDKVLLSNGPGDPMDAKEGIELVKNLIGKIPIYGICLGHQILALALGAKTYKLKFGHRGANHPVINLESNRVFITSQNHGYAVDEQTLPNDVKVTYKNINDGTLEGFKIEKYNIKAVQFHPEAAPGPKDVSFIFKEWFS